MQLTVRGTRRPMRPSLLLVALVFCSVMGACERRKSAPSETSAAPSGSALPAPKPRCKALGSDFVLGSDSAPVPNDTSAGGASQLEPELQLGLPFAVEVGGAAVDREGRFAVGYTAESRQGVALLSPELELVKRLDLGKQQADAAPPVVAASNHGLFIVVPSTDAQGGSLDLRWWSPGSEPTAPRNVDADNDESRAVDAAAIQRLGLVVWDDWDPAKDHSVIRLLRFDATDPKAPKAASPSVVSRAGTDAEAPRIVRAQAGFWLAWLVNAPKLPPPKPLVPKPVAPNSPTPKSDDSQPSATERPNLPRWVELVGLDELGEPRGEAIQITPTSDSVAGFDIVADVKGDAYVAWRAGLSVLGGEGGRLHLTRIDPAGALDTRLVDDKNLGSGLPSLLAPSDASTDASKTAPVWLTMAGVGDAMRSAPLSSAFQASSETPASEQLRAEPALRDASVLVNTGQRLLVAKPRGRAVELSLVSCSP